MADLETIRQKLAEQIIKNGYTFRQMSLKIGRKDSYIQQYIRYGFPRRLNEIDRHRICHILRIDEKELVDDELKNNSAEHPMSLCFADKLGNPEDLVLIDIHTTHSTEDYFDSVVGRMALNYKEFSNWCNTNPHNLKIIRIEGDSMSPAIPPESLIIYDTNVRQYTGDGIYIIQTHNIIQVKRVQQEGSEQYTLLSDNPNYKETRVTKDEITFLGRALRSLTPQTL